MSLTSRSTRRAIRSDASSLGSCMRPMIDQSFRR